MISWMQKHNKYLVWTIWIATIAFIGAGFVGWGSYNFGSKAGNVAKVGDIDIKQNKLNMVYSNLYSQYNERLGGRLDKEQAEKMGLVKQAFSIVTTQAKVLNFAQDTGIIVSDKELVTKLHTIKGFQKDGVFNKELYTNYLQAQRLKAKDFEETLRDDMTVQKTLSILKTKDLPLEIEAIGAAMNVADKLNYTVLTTADINYTSDEAKVKAFWETQKENYMTPRKYNLSLVWIESNNSTVTEDELKNHYETNSFNYTDAKGKQLDFEKAKEQVRKDLKLKKTKKTAQKAYISFKKGKIKSAEDITLPENDLKLTPAIWKEIKTKSTGDILKPKVIDNRYVTIKINSIEEPKVMTYEQAQNKVKNLYDTQAKKEALLALAKATLNDNNNSHAITSDFVTLKSRDNLKALNSQESLQFLQKLFTSNKEKGIISIFDKIVVYTIIEQKLLAIDDNSTTSVKQTVEQMKKTVFDANFLKVLDKKYPTQTYVRGLTN